MTKLILLPLLAILCSCYYTDPEPNDRPFLISGSDECPNDLPAVVGTWEMNSSETK